MSGDSMDFQLSEIKSDASEVLSKQSSFLTEQNAQQILIYHVVSGL